MCHRHMGLESGRITRPGSLLDGVMTLEALEYLRVRAKKTDSENDRVWGHAYMTSDVAGGSGPPKSRQKE